MRRLALALTLLCGCKEEGRSDTIRLYYFEALDTHPEETINEAAEILGMELLVAETPRRSVIVTYWPGLPEDGESASADECGRAIFARDDSRTLAHEIAHAMYLEHSDDPANLMYETWDPDSTDLTDDQVDTMRWAAWLLEQCPK